MHAGTSRYNYYSTIIKPGRLTHTYYTVQAVNARIGAQAASLGVHHWVGVKPGLRTGLIN